MSSRGFIVPLHTASVAIGDGVLMELWKPGQPTYTLLSVQVEGISTATVIFESSNDGATFYAHDLVAVGTMETPVNQATADGFFRGEIVARYFRARISAWTSGTVVVTALAVER